MRLGRSMLGVLVGTLLGLGIVALTIAGAGPAAAPTVISARSASNATEIIAPASTNASVRNNMFYSAIGIGNRSGIPSQLGSMAKQPIPLTALTLLPIVAAAAFGLALYRLSKGRTEKDEPEPK